MKRWGMGVLLALACAGTATAVAPPAQVTLDKPMLWRVCDRDSCLNLFGSFHALNAGDNAWSDEVQGAFERSQRVYFEVAPMTEADRIEAGMGMLSAGIRRDGQRLSDTLDPATRARLQSVLRTHADRLSSLGLRPGLSDGFEAWYVALLLSLAQLTDVGLDAEHGVDKQLERAVQDSGKPALGLETAQQQIDVLDGMALHEQNEVLREALDEFERGPAQFATLRAQYLKGDPAAFWRVAGAEMQARYPGLYARLQVDRNRRWQTALEAELARDHEGESMVVVGALHLLGEDGLLKAFRDAGFRVERQCALCNGD